MLEVGCDHGPGGEDDPGLSYVEARTHFGAWCIVSSPLILSHDTNNDTITDEIWPIISNTEAIAINQAWAGDSGTIFASSRRVIAINPPAAVDHPNFPAPLEADEQVATHAASWQQWSKKLGDKQAALLVMNNDGETQTVTVKFSDMPTFKDASFSTFSLRDVWAHKDLGEAKDGWTVTLESHDSAFLVVDAVA
jgi:hypothetical protein